MKKTEFQIMFCLAILDMVAIMANCVLFGVLLLEVATINGFKRKVSAF